DVDLLVGPVDPLVAGGGQRHSGADGRGRLEEVTAVRGRHGTAPSRFGCWFCLTRGGSAPLAALGSRRNAVAVTSTSAATATGKARRWRMPCPSCYGRRRGIPRSGGRSRPGAAPRPLGARS